MELRWGERTHVMGILNLTPDSFSGDGLAVEGSPPETVLAAALAQAATFVEAGAERSRRRMTSTSNGCGSSRSSSSTPCRPRKRMPRNVMRSLTGPTARCHPSPARCA